MHLQEEVELQKNKSQVHDCQDTENKEQHCQISSPDFKCRVDDSPKRSASSSEEGSPDRKKLIRRKQLKKFVLEDSESDQEEFPSKMPSSSNEVLDKNEDVYMSEGTNSPLRPELEMFDNLKSELKTKKNKKIKQALLDDSDTDDEISDRSKKPSPDTNEDLPDKVTGNISSYKSMNTDLYDAEGSSDEETRSSSIPEPLFANKTEQEKKSNKGDIKRNNLQRKSKQSALEEIHSETQRLIRHSRVSLPYHQPKQHSLSEFLSRRKVLPFISIKTRSDQLTEVWKSIEEREKTAEEFYRSESDSCEDEDKKVPSPNKNVDKTIETNDIDPSDSEKASVSKECPDNLTPPISGRNESTMVDDQSDKNASPPSVINFPNCKTIALNSSSLDTDKIEDNSEKILNNFEFPDTNFKELQMDNNEKSVPQSSFSENTDDFKLLLTEADGSEINLFSSEGSSERASEEFNKPALSESKTEMKNKRISLLNNSLMDVKLDAIPKISGKPDEVIDLDDFSEKPAALQLVSRFIKHVSLKSKKKKQENKLSIAVTEVNANGEIISLNEEVISIQTNEKSKPGESRTQLKESLKQQIARSREEQFVKRVEEYKLSEELFEEDDAKDISEGEDLEEELIEPSDSSESEGESEPEENDIDMSDKKTDKENPFLDEEAEESENEDKDPIESGEEEQLEEDTYSDPPSIAISPLIDEKDEDITTKKGGASANGINSIDSNEFMNLCSGVFPSQAVNFTDLEKNDHMDPPSQSFKTISEEAISESGKKMPDDTDSSDEEIFTKKAKKNTKLEFSDDEDDDNVDAPKSPVSNESANESEPEIINDGGDDDDGGDEGVLDENNEDVLDEEEEEYFRNDPSVAAKRYLEDEAELSGSEYGSADEDEVDLDNYEEEQGDLDQLNQKKLKAELEKIHMKEIMDEDKREIRILQELLLEDGELHADGPRRQRQFKWYNQDEGDADRSIYLNTFDDEDDSKKEGNEEEEEDESWRKTRLERENYLQGVKNDDDDLQLPQNIKRFNKENKALKPVPKVQTNSSPNPKKHFSLMSTRGSFLSRGEKVLSKIAEMTNVSGDNPLGKGRGKNNMVFAVVSPPKEEIPQEEEVKKRKNNDLLPSVSKRLKFNSGKSNINRKSIFENLD